MALVAIFARMTVAAIGCVELEVFVFRDGGRVLVISCGALLELLGGWRVKGEAVCYGERRGGRPRGLLKRMHECAAGAVGAVAAARGRDAGV